MNRLKKLLDIRDIFPLIIAKWPQIVFLVVSQKELVIGLVGGSPNELVKGKWPVDKVLFYEVHVFLRRDMNANVFGADDTLQVLNSPFGSTWSDVKVSDDKGLTLWLLKKGHFISKFM